MVFVHHARHAIKAEAIELVLVHPKAQVGKKEAKNLWVTIVEEARVPQVVTSTSTLMEVQVVSPIKVVESVISAASKQCPCYLPIEDILARM